MSAADLDTWPGPGALSLNQKTTDRWSIAEAVAGCVRAGIESVGLWRESVAETGLQRTAALVRSADLRVSSLCRGGFLTAADETGRRAALADNRRAIDEAAALNAGCLVLVVGGLPPGSKDLPAARARVVEAIGELAGYAGDAGVQLALEPLHPMFCADRAVLSTLGQALDIAEHFPSNEVGVVVDTYHVWWDPDVWNEIDRATGRIASFQVCDWLTPLPSDVLLGRGMMGAGHIQFRPFVEAVRSAGYRGDIEVEIFNADVWASDPDSVVTTMKASFASEVLGSRS